MSVTQQSPRQDETTELQSVGSDEVFSSEVEDWGDQHEQTESVPGIFGESLDKAYDEGSDGYSDEPDQPTYLVRLNDDYYPKDITTPLEDAYRYIYLGDSNYSDDNIFGDDDFADEIVRRIREPAWIDQKATNFCGPCSLLISLANGNPRKYAEVAATALNWWESNKSTAVIQEITASGIKEYDAIPAYYILKKYGGMSMFTGNSATDIYTRNQFLKKAYKDIIGKGTPQELTSGKNILTFVQDPSSQQGMRNKLFNITAKISVNHLHAAGLADTSGYIVDHGTRDGTLEGRFDNNYGTHYTAVLDISPRAVTVMDPDGGRELAIPMANVKDIIKSMIIQQN